MFPLGGGGCLLLGEGGVLVDGSMDLGVEGLYTGDLGGLEALVPLGELLEVFLLGLFLQGFHVLVNMHTEDPVTVDLGIIGGVFTIIAVAGELVGGVGHI